MKPFVENCLLRVAVILVWLMFLDLALSRDVFWMMFVFICEMLLSRLLSFETVIVCLGFDIIVDKS